MRLVATAEENRLYRQLGNAHVHLVKTAGDAVKTDALSGRLYFSRTGWLLLSVPNALGRGAFDALDEAGVELPTSESTGQYNAHITVFRPEEIEQIGGPDKITERGHSYRYSLGAIKEVEPAAWKDVSKVWYITVDSPELKELRRSYGLTPLPNNNEHDFHITIGVRKKRVLYDNEKSKAASDKSGDPRHGCVCPNCGGTNTHGARAIEKFADGTWDYANVACSDCDNGFSFDYDAMKPVKQTTGPRGQKQAGIISIEEIRAYAREKRGPEGEYCPHCDARLERDSYTGTCNSCGKDWPEKKADAETSLYLLLTTTPADRLLSLLEVPF